MIPRVSLRFTLGYDRIGLSARINMLYAREHYIIYAVGEDYLEGSVSKKGSFSLSTKVRVFLKPPSL